MSITGPPGSLTVRARQKLKDPKAAEAFINQLQAKLQKHIEANETVAFEDFDISQNPLSYDQFDVLFTTLSTTNVRVERIRLFGCATLDDSVASLVASWLESVAPDTCPYEVHLSDCAMTTAGFESIMAAVEGNEAWPFQEPRKTVKVPMYIRLEGNYIAEPSIQEKVDAGVIACFKKSDGSIRAPISSAPDAKIKMLIRDQGQYNQKEGVPPSPEEAPPPKKVWDWDESQKWKQNDWQWNKGEQNKGGWGQNKGGWQANKPVASWKPQAKSWQQQPAKSWQQQPAKPGIVNAVAAKGVGKGAARPQTVAQTVAARPGYNGNAAGKGAAATKGGLKGNAGSAAARSRTPPPKPTKLPPPWEEHFSEEYGIAYFWNSETSESSWERPTA